MDLLLVLTGASVVTDNVARSAIRAIPSSYARFTVALTSQLVAFVTNTAVGIAVTRRARPN